MKQLKNIRHTFDTPMGEIGVTVRKGEKWSKDVSVGEIIELWNCSEPHSGECREICSREGKGRIVGWWVNKYMHLPDSLVALEHNKEARKRHVLESMLIMAYGCLEHEDIVTALIYERIA